jgi:hypothetical protein
MSLPKFTAEASIETYGNAYANRKYNYDYDNSVKIEPAYPVRRECHETNCRTRMCKYICSLGPPVEKCDGTMDVCTMECYVYHSDGSVTGPENYGNSYSPCSGN